MLNIKNGKVKCIGYERNERYFTAGKVYDVVDNTITNDKGFTYNFNYSGESVVDWLSGWYKFEAVPTDKIVIVHDGKTTTATLYLGDEKVVTTARCAPEDKFDFMVGAVIALTRLNKEINKPKFYNGKVVCIKADTDHWTVGKVYEVKDGVIMSDKHLAHPRFGKPYRDAEDVRHAGCIVSGDKRHNPDNEFVPLIEN